MTRNSASSDGAESRLPHRHAAALSRATRRVLMLCALLSTFLTVPLSTQASDERLVAVNTLLHEARLVVTDGETAEILIDATGGEDSQAPTMVVVPSSCLEVHRLAPGLFQVVSTQNRHKFWRVNALGGTMWGVVAGIVGIDGGWSLGNYRRPCSFVSVLPAAPEDARAGNFQLLIRDLELVIRPAERTLVIESDGIQLATEKTLELQQVRAFLFHLRLGGHGEGPFLAVNAGGKEVRLLRPGQEFGTEVAGGRVLNASVQPIRSGGRYGGSNIPVLLEPARGAVLDNGSSTGDRAVWTFRWTVVDGADLYELAVDGHGARKVRHEVCVITWRGQGYGGSGRTAEQFWKVRARREGKWLPWSKTGMCAGIEPFNTDQDATLVDYLADDPSKVDRRAGSAPRLKKPKAGAVLDNGRADGLDSLSWAFEWGRVSGIKDYEIVIVSPHDHGPFLRERVRGVRFEFDSDEYRIFGGRRRLWFWRVRPLGRHGPGRWSEKRYFHVEPLDADPPREGTGLAKNDTPDDTPILLTPKPGVRLERDEPGEKHSRRPGSWTFRWRAVPGAEAYDFEYGTRGRGWTPAHRERVEKPILKVESGEGMSGWGRDLYGFGWRVRAIRDGKPLPWSPLRPFDVVTR